MRPATFRRVRLLGHLTAWVCGLAAGLAAFMTMLSAMLFDAPGSTSNPWLLAFAGGLWAAPVIFLFGVIKGMAVAREPNWRPLAVAWAWIAGLILFLGGATLGLILQCGGQFVCQ